MRTTKRVFDEDQEFSNVYERFGLNPNEFYNPSYITVVLKDCVQVRMLTAQPNGYAYVNWVGNVTGVDDQIACYFRSDLETFYATHYLNMRIIGLKYTVIPVAFGTDNRFINAICTLDDEQDFPIPGVDLLQACSSPNVDFTTPQRQVTYYKDIRAWLTGKDIDWWDTDVRPVPNDPSSLIKVFGYGWNSQRTYAFAYVFAEWLVQYKSWSS